MSQVNQEQLIAKGRTAEVYSWQGDHVLKLFYDWCPEAWIKREADISRRVSESSLPTPKFIGLATLDHRQGIIYERVYGPSMLRVISSKPWLLKGQARLLAELHSKIHEQGGEGLPQVRAWLVESIAQTPRLPAELKKKALAALGQLPDGNALCHFDFHPDQVLITAKGPVIIDWMSAFQGDPLADVARTSVLAMLAKAPHMKRLMRTAINAARGVLHKEYLRRYRELHPAVTMEAIRRWMIPVAAARLNEKISGEEASIIPFLERPL
jgi:aminoglycoside phosphotransferase (APT) family kinase protein